MQYIIFLILISLNLLNADSDNFSKKVWGFTPPIYNETEPISTLKQNRNIVKNVSSYPSGSMRVASTSQEINTGWVNQEDIVEIKDEASPSSGWVADISPDSDSVYIDNQTIDNSNIITNESEVITKPEIVVNNQQSVQSDISSQNVNETVTQATILDEEVLPSTPRAKIIENSYNIDEYIENLKNFIEPLTMFLKDNLLLAATLFTTIFLFFYLLFSSPAKKEESNDFDEDFYIPDAILAKNKTFENDNPNSSQQQVNHNINHIVNSAILTQNQYTTLYGLINETFIYEKERIVLSSDITQDRKNRELIALEWKSNQILHFSLPKLSSENSYQFTDGVLELLDDSLTKDILIVALKDIIGSNKIQESDKMKIRRKLAQLTDKKEHV